MAADFPFAVFTAMTRGALMSDATTQGDFVDKLQDELHAVESTLGVNPQGAYATVKARLDAMVGTSTSWTPTWANATLGTGGTSTGQYLRVGPATVVRAQLLFGTGGALTGALSITNLPVNPTVTFAGHVDMIESSGPTQFFGDCRFIGGTATANIHTRTVSGSLVASGSVNATSPFTFNSGDSITVTGVYL